MIKTKTQRRAEYVQACYKSGSLESYIEQRLNKLNNNPVITTNHERSTKK
jgi:hypothetical protein